jgi:hypothetical protein
LTYKWVLLSLMNYWFKRKIIYRRISACCRLAWSNLMSISGVRLEVDVRFMAPKSPFSFKCS